MPSDHREPIGLVPGPYTALYRSSLKHCTLTNKAVVTIWRDFSESPQRRQDPEPRPLWVLHGTPSVLGPKLASRRAQSCLAYSVYISEILFLSPYMLVLWFLWPLRFGLLFVLGLHKRDFFLQILNACPFDYIAFVVGGKVGIPQTGLSTSIKWMMSIAILINRCCVIGHNNVPKY